MGCVGLVLTSEILSRASRDSLSGFEFMLTSFFLGRGGAGWGREGDCLILTLTLNGEAGKGRGGEGGRGRWRREGPWSATLKYTVNVFPVFIWRRKIEVPKQPAINALKSAVFRAWS